MHRSRTWALNTPELRTGRNRGLAATGGDSSALTLDFSSGVLDSRISGPNRTSTATFVNKQGYVEFAGHNLLNGSTRVIPGENSWGTSVIGGTAAISSTVVAPDGSYTATEFTEDTNNTYHRVYQGVSGQNNYTGYVYTHSVYLKAGTITKVNLTDNTISGGGITADLTAGTITYTGANVISATITSVGNGWYRVTNTVKLTSNSSTWILFFLDSSGASTYTGAGKNIYIWGPQTNHGPVQVYYPTTTAAYHAPRFDYDPTNVGTFRGLLTEVARANYACGSEDFSNSCWNYTANNANKYTVTNQTLPTGLTGNIVSVCEKTTNGTHVAYLSTSSINMVANTPYTFSVFVKVGDLNYARIGVLNFCSVVIDFTETVTNNMLKNAVGSTLTDITKYPNDWYRVSITFNSGSSTGNCYPFVGPALNTINDGTAWVGVSNTKGVFFWGAQFEVSPVASSYYPSPWQGSAGYTTRAQETYSIQGTALSSFYKNANQGTFYIDGYQHGTARNSSWMFTLLNSSASLDTNSNRPGLYLGNASTATTWSSRFYTDSSTPYVLSSAIDKTLPNNTVVLKNVNTKAAFAFKVNDAYLSVNGSGSASTGGSGSVTFTNPLNYIGLGNSSGGSYSLWIKAIKYWPMRLDNATLNLITNPSTTSPSVPFVTVYPVELLLIGGGGGGGGAKGSGTHAGGGGGGGGIAYIPQYNLIGGQSNYTFTIGDGGAGGRPNTGSASAGSPTELYHTDEFSPDISVSGGGAGGEGNTTDASIASGKEGACGGGSSSYLSASAGISTNSLSFNGGGPGTAYTSSIPANAYYGAGGGGIGGKGSNGNEGGGSGGAGVLFAGVYYSAGGGGGAKNVTSVVIPTGGSSSSGGNGGTGSVTASNGNTYGSGGGGAGYIATGATNYKGGNGASGVVIIRYPGTSANPNLSYDGDWSTDVNADGYVYHYLTTSGILYT